MSEDDQRGDDPRKTWEDLTPSQRRKAGLPDREAHEDRFIREERTDPQPLIEPRSKKP